MAVRLVQRVTRYVLDDTADVLALPVSPDIEVGAEAIVLPHGTRWIWTGTHWKECAAETASEKAAASASEELLLEVRAIRTGIELFLALERGVHVDLLTEQLTEVSSDGQS